MHSRTASCHVFFFSQKHFLIRTCLLIVGGITLLSARVVIMGGSPPSFAPSDNPAAASDSVMTRTLTFLHLPALDAWLLLCPCYLSFDWSMEAVPLLQQLHDPRNIWTFFFYGVLALLAVQTFFIRIKGKQKLK